MPGVIGKLQNKLKPSRLKEKIAEKVDGVQSRSRADSSAANSSPSRDDSLSPRKSASDKREEKQQKKAEHEREKQEREKEQEERRRMEEELAARQDPPEMRARYGVYPINQSKERKHVPKFTLSTLASDPLFGREILFTARIHTIRRMSSHLVFIVLRQQEWTVQGVLREKEGLVSVHFVRWAEHLPPESIVLVKAVVKEPEKDEITGATIHNAELDIAELHLTARVTQSPVFSVYDADITNGELERGEPRRKNISDRTRLNNRIVDLRTATGQSVFRVQAGICSIFRSHLENLGFIEIHTPKLQGGATESGSSVFQLDYFGRPAFLAQSPQLAKQMSITADFNRVYEIGPVFRAENSNTHRHLTEYTGLDLEMAIDEHYHEALDVIDGLFKAMWAGTYNRHRHEVDLIKRQFPHDDLIWLEETPRIPFAEGVRLLNDSGWEDEDGEPQSELEDLSTKAEIRLGELIKAKYETDYYILDKFPASARPFYTMPDPGNDKVTNSFDIFLRGQEILSGGQRIHDAQLLEDRMKELNMQQEGMEEYLDGFRFGAPPHAGGGIGLERVVMLLLELGDIRQACMYPRDPQSLKAKRPPTDQLRHPEASTLHPPWEGKVSREGYDFQPIEKLIANYGDATSTSLLEDRVKVWRCEESGAAIGYTPQGSHAICLGDPLCEKSQYGKTISTFLRFLKKEEDLSPIWLNVSDEVEEVLGSGLGWKTMSNVAEERVNLVNSKAHQKKEIQRKVNHAKKEGVSIRDYGLGSTIPDDLQEKVGKRMADWLENRKGTQVHLTKLDRPRVFRDFEHRWFFIGTDKQGEICTMVTLTQLSHQHGMQVKYVLDFPGAPSGAIEATIVHALDAAKEAGVKNVTFGAGATEELTPGYNLSGVKVRMLRQSYNAIVPRLGVSGKSEFRDKLGAEEDPLHVCYPKNGMGASGTKAIMDFLQSEG